MTTRRAALGLLGATSIGALALQTPAGAAPARVPKGLRPGGELDRFIAGQAAKDIFSGSVLVTHRGRTVLARSHGWADKARGVRNGPETLFGLASVAKLFVGVGIAQLAQRCQLGYADPIGAHLTGFPAEIADRVTIHHLLTHTSGFGDYMRLPGYFEAARAWTSVAESFEGTGRFVRTETLGFPPGSAGVYSNSGFHLLNEIIVRVAGKPVDDYSRERIFRPAGMTSTDAYTLPQVRGDRRIAHGYWRPPGSTERVDSLDEQFFSSGTFSTCAEMARFAQALWEERLLNPAYTRLVLSPKLPMGPPSPPPGQEPPPGPPPIAFGGYGPIAQVAGDRWSYGHTGGAHNGASTALEFYPDSGYAVVVLSNYADGAIRGIPSLARRLIIDQE